MGGQIFVEADDVEFLGLPSGAKHLYLVHRDTNSAEYVIRSGPEDSWFGGDMAIEANVPIEPPPMSAGTRPRPTATAPSWSSTA